eukprot:1534945-Pyramimonas_sp.AAC.1
MKIALKSVRGTIKWLLQAHESHVSHGRVDTFTRPRKLKSKKVDRKLVKLEAHQKHVFPQCASSSGAAIFAREGPVLRRASSVSPIVFAMPVPWPLAVNWEARW